METVAPLPVQNAVVTIEKWQQVIQLPPDYFINALCTLVSNLGGKLPAGGVGLPSERRAFLLALFTSFSISHQETWFNLVKAKWRETMEYKVAWQQCYPQASAEAAEIMLSMRSAILHLTDIDCWCHVPPAVGGHGQLLFQMWPKTESAQAKPALLYEYSITVGKGLFKLNKKREALGRDMLASIPADSAFMLTSEAVISSKFRTDYGYVLTRSMRQRMQDDMGGFFGIGLYG